MNAINQAAITPAPLPKLSLAIPAIGNTINAPNMAGSAVMAYQTDSSADRPSFVKNMAPKAIDHENRGGRGFMPPTG